MKMEEKEQEKEERGELARIWERRRGNLYNLKKENGENLKKEN